MRHDMRDKSYRVDVILPYVMEYGIYVFIFLMFAGKLGTLREAAFYIPLAAWLSRAIATNRIGFNWRDPLFLSMLFLSLSGLLSSFVNDFSLQGLFIFKKVYLKPFFLCCVLAATFRRPESARRCGAFFALAGIVYTFVAFFEMGRDLYSLGKINYDVIRNFSTVLLFFLPFTLWQVFLEENNRRALWQLAVAGEISAILLVGVRGGWLALLTVLFLWGLALRKRSRGFYSTIKKATPFVLLLAILAFFVFPANYYFLKKHTFQKIQISLRFEAWKNFIRLSMNDILFGHGLDDNVMSENYRNSFRQVHGEFPPPEKPTSPHNQFIKFLYQQGALGLLVYLMLSVLLIRNLLQVNVLLGSDYSFMLLAALSAAIGEYLVRCFFEDRSLIPLGILVGLILASKNTERTEHDNTIHPAGNTP